MIWVECSAQTELLALGMASNIKIEIMIPVIVFDDTADNCLNDTNFKTT